MHLCSADQDIRPKKEGPGPQLGPKVMSRGDVPRAIYDGSKPLTINPCMCGGH